ncbi:MAG: bifunctional DNA-formamidopyrimidine glycosylase/DNA-(apurinic or apyrimidinic site) lyase, partial [Candidatus Methanomethylophilaceae archaeon]|nr:bifunctional DNA-formamidopyrimidine glycosylase/DNA-(apurinic or apyrimidinic site) lyase [Candidatus Methanomethylophilaceae archaeon]
MPELPEVETTRRMLSGVIGRRIVEASVLDPKFHVDNEALVGSPILDIARRAKYITVSLCGGSSLVVHLGMTGSLVHLPEGSPMPRYVRAAFVLDDGSTVVFDDPRRFGKVSTVRPGDPPVVPEDLGPEPFPDTLSADILYESLGRRGTSLKVCLLDQKVVAGLGNIHADEALFRAGLRPDRPASSLDRGECSRLCKAICDEIAEAIGNQDMSYQDFISGMGRDYRDSGTFKVYGRGGLPCTVCGTPLVRIRLASRSSVYCPCCQHRGSFISNPPVRLPMKIYVVDNGGQWTHREWRVLRYLKVDTKIVPNTTPLAEIQDADGLILSGGAPSVASDADRMGNNGEYLDGFHGPILGICAGMQFLCEHFGGSLGPGTVPEFG